MKLLIFTLTIITTASIAFLILPHFSNSLNFLAKKEWYNGSLITIFIFAAVSLYVVVRQYWKKNLKSD